MTSLCNGRNVLVSIRWDLKHLIVVTQKSFCEGSQAQIMVKEVRNCKIRDRRRQEEREKEMAWLLQEEMVHEALPLTDDLLLLHFCCGHAAQMGILGSRLEPKEGHCSLDAGAGEGWHGSFQGWHCLQKEWECEDWKEFALKWFKRQSSLGRDLLQNGGDSVKFRAAWEMHFVVKQNGKMKGSPESLETRTSGYQQHSSATGLHPAQRCLMWPQFYFSCWLCQENTVLSDVITDEAFLLLQKVLQRITYSSSSLSYLLRGRYGRHYKT